MVCQAILLGLMRSKNNYVQQLTVADKLNYQLHLTVFSQKNMSASQCFTLPANRQTDFCLELAFLISLLSRMLYSQDLIHFKEMNIFKLINNY